MLLLAIKILCIAAIAAMIVHSYMFTPDWAAFGDRLFEGTTRLMIGLGVSLCFVYGVSVETTSAVTLFWLSLTGGIAYLSLWYQRFLSNG